MENNKEIIHESEVKELIIELRGEKVLIDRDVAKLYGVETKSIYRKRALYAGYNFKKSESYRNYFCHYRIIL